MNTSWDGGLSTEVEHGHTTVVSQGLFGLVTTDYSFSYEVDTCGWRQEMPPENEHAAAMAAVAIANGAEDPEVRRASRDRHTGMAPGAGVVPIGDDAVRPCTDEAEDDENVWLYHTGPQAVEKAGDLGVDVFVSAISRFTQPPDFSRCLSGSGPNTTNFWDADERNGPGREYADALDEAFRVDELLSFVSAGNRAPSADEALGKWAIGLGKSSFTAIPCGAMSVRPDCSGSSANICSAQFTDKDQDSQYRVKELQQMGWWISMACGNLAGPTGDNRNYPLILGWSGMCGVPMETPECEEASLPTDSYHKFNGTSPATATIGGAALVFQEWLTLEFGETFASNSAFLRTHLLNMGDRMGTYCTSTYTWYAFRGIPRHAGFGKLRLRLLEPCYFNDGSLEYRATTFEEAGEEYTWEIEPEQFESGPLPADLSRIRLCVWLEQYSEEALGDAYDRPWVIVLLERRVSTSDDWELFDLTFSGDEFEELRDTSAERNVGIIRDPHVNLARDNEWPAFPLTNDGVYSGSITEPWIDGGWHYRVRVWCGELPNGPVTAHISLLWETGKDLSSAANRMAGLWSCLGSGKILAIQPLSVLTGGGASPMSESDAPGWQPDSGGRTKQWTKGDSSHRSETHVQPSNESPGAKDEACEPCSRS